MKWLVLAVALGFLGLAQGRSEGDARIVVARSVKTAIAFNTVTSTNPVTCIFAANAAVCQRRRFRRFMPIIDHENQETLVDSSLDKDTDDEEEDVPRQGKRGGRIAVTLWTTVSSTFTITTTSTDTLTTFSLSYFCTVNGASSPPSCG
ncbi:uncharacterized protein LOC121864874 [Homarus americanus]|nr:uncharacterized protein LOC121864874 [Homarus americanus]